MSYRSAPPDPTQPVYHGSAFPWSVVETSGAIHVGDHTQATDLTPKRGGEPSPVLLRKGGTGGDSWAEPDVDGTRVRAFNPPPSVPNGGMNELSFNPGVGFHDVDASDIQANTAHLIHSREAGYARGGSIDQSSLNSQDLSPYAATPDENSTPRHQAVHSQLQALRENKVLRYANVMEGDGTGVSYVVPNPDVNLRQFGEEPKPVAGKSYHQTPLPGMDLAAVRNPGPFDEHFDDGGPDHLSFGDRRAPNMSRIRKRSMAPIKATTSAAPTNVPGQEAALF